MYGLSPYKITKLSIKNPAKKTFDGRMSQFFMDKNAFLYGLSHNMSAVSVIGMCGRWRESKILEENVKIVLTKYGKNRMMWTRN